jgi:hypothetical protein
MPVVSAGKHECLNPRTGRSMRIAKETYELFYEAVTHVLREDGPLSFSGIVDRVQAYFKNHKIKFEGSVDWYAITVKNDLEARGKIETVIEKGRKLNRLSK